MQHLPVQKKPGLSASKVHQITEPGKYYDQHGLFLRVAGAGSKSWVQRLTIDGQQKEIGLGSYRYVSLAEARDLAFKNKKMAAAGMDPVVERRRQKKIPTFNESVEHVYALHAPNWRNMKHAAQFRTTLLNVAGPVFGDLRISEVMTSHVMQALAPIWLETPETARRVKQRIGVVMKWAIAQGYRGDDPSNAVQQALPKVRRQVNHRRSLPYDQVSACLSDVRATQARASTKLALEFLVLTAARSGEVRLATWQEVDLQTGLWSIPADRMKAGVEHIVPLSEQAVQILLKAQKLSGRGYIFGGSRTGRPMSDMTLSKLVKGLGYDADIHGFRTSFRVWVQEQTDTAFEVAEKALAHTIRNKAVAAYARSDHLEKRRVLMQRWANFLTDNSTSVPESE